MKPQGLPPKGNIPDPWPLATRGRERQRAGREIADQQANAIHPRELSACDCRRPKETPTE